jgi:hypothetical protein
MRRNPFSTAPTRIEDSSVFDGGVIAFVRRAHCGAFSSSKATATCSGREEAALTDVFRVGEAWSGRKSFPIWNHRSDVCDAVKALFFQKPLSPRANAEVHDATTAMQHLSAENMVDHFHIAETYSNYMIS